jgi:hypothetical protein
VLFELQEHNERCKTFPCPRKTQVGAWSTGWIDTTSSGGCRLLSPRRPPCRHSFSSGRCWSLESPQRHVLYVFTSTPCLSKSI